MKLFSELLRFCNKNYTLGGIHRAEQRIVAILKPSDWFIVGIFFFITILGAGILFAGASSGISEKVPVRGGTHTEGVIGSPRFINPLLSLSETDKDITLLVFGGLMRAHSDGSLNPYLAANYEISPDGLVYTFTMKDDIKFHDGHPIDAEDVVFTVQYAQNPDIKSPRRANWEGVTVQALDEKTVQFMLREPYGLFLENTTLGILPKHLWEDITPEEFPFSDLNTDPVGSGPYRVDTIKKNTSGVASMYRLTAAGTTADMPYITTLNFRFYPNQQTLTDALLNGTIDAAHSISFNVNEKVKNEHVVKEAIFSRVFGIFFNQNQQDLFTDEIVRIALDSALDKQLIIDTVLNGYGTPLSGPLPPQEVLDNEMVQSENDRIAQARELLAEYGWQPGEDGVLEKGSDEKKRLSFTVTTGNAPELKTAAEAVAQTWRELGAEVRLEFFDHNDLNLEVIRPRSYDALLFGLVVGREPDLFAFWHSSQRNDPGLNIALYANITADKLLESARSTLDPEDRRTIALDAAEEIARETAAIFLYAPHFTYVHEPTLNGVTIGAISTPSDRFAGIEDWYVHTESVWPFFRN
ncbi:MAG: ABC transporter substrate-binding protein [Patescibacteria group bacterium UBA2163]